MSSYEHIDVYYPPGQAIDANRVGEVSIIRDVERSKTRVYSTFLGEPFGRDILLSGKLLRERRTEWATRRAYSRVLFHAEGVLGSEIPGQFATDPDTLL